MSVKITKKFLIEKIRKILENKLENESPVPGKRSSKKMPVRGVAMAEADVSEKETLQEEDDDATGLTPTQRARRRELVKSLDATRGGSFNREEHAELKVLDRIAKAKRENNKEALKRHRATYASKYEAGAAAVADPAKQPTKESKNEKEQLSEGPTFAYCRLPGGKDGMYVPTTKEEEAKTGKKSKCVSYEQAMTLSKTGELDEDAKINTPEQENKLYESRFSKRNTNLFEKLIKEWAK